MRNELHSLQLARRFNGFFEAVTHLDRPMPDLVASAFARHLAGLAPGELPAVLRPNWEDILARYLGLRDDVCPTAADARRLARLSAEDVDRLLETLSSIRQEFNTRRTATWPYSSA